MNQINTSELDPASKSIFLHLQETLVLLDSSPIELNVSLIENYLARLAIDRSIVFPNGSSGSIEDVKQNTYLTSFVPVLTNLLQHPKTPDVNAVITLLLSILTYLTFHQINYFFPDEFIVTGIVSNTPKIVDFIIRVLTAKVEDNQTQQFLVDSEALDLLVSRYLTISDYDLFPISIVNRIEHFIDSVVITNLWQIIQKLLSPSFISLYKSTAVQSNTILKVRLLDYIVLLVPVLGPDFPTPLLDFDPLVFLDELDYDDPDYDPLFPMLLIQFYTKTLKAMNVNQTYDLLPSLQGPLSKLADVYAEKFKNPLVEEKYADEIIDVLLALSKTPRASDSFLSLVKKHFLLKSYNLDLTNPVDVNFLTKINFDPFDTDALDDFYADIISGTSLLNTRYLGVLINLMKNTHLFQLIANDGQLTSEKVSKLSQDVVYFLILNMTKHEHTAQYLLNSLPSLVTNQLIGSPSEIRDRVLWDRKLESLENLLFKQDPGIWKSELAESYSLMKNGRSFRNIAPAVDVTDETL